MTGTRRALVIGAGPGGLAAALALRQAGYEPTVCEAAPELRPVGSGLTLWPNALRALELLGVGETIRADARPFAGIAMHRADGTRLFFVPGWVPGAGRGFGWAAALHRAELQATLLGALGAARVRVGARCVGVEQDETAATAVLDSGERLRAELVVGADGLRSRVREACLGAEAPRWAGYRVWRGVAELPLDAEVGTTSMGRGAQFGVFPMSRGRVYWFASLTVTRDEAAPADAHGWLRARFAEWHHPIPALLDATPPDAIVASDIYDKKPIRRWSWGRVTLLGDAAHPSVPTLGQGACQAFEDAATIGRCLSDSGGDVPVALQRYQERRRRRANGVTDQSWRIGQIGQWRNAAACGVRDWLMKLTPESLQLSQLRAMFDYQP